MADEEFSWDPKAADWPWGPDVPQENLNCSLCGHPTETAHSIAVPGWCHRCTAEGRHCPSFLKSRDAMLSFVREAALFPPRTAATLGWWVKQRNNIMKEMGRDPEEGGAMDAETVYTFPDPCLHNGQKHCDGHWTVKALKTAGDFVYEGLLNRNCIRGHAGEDLSCGGCHATGKIKCRSCHGTGNYPCPDCNGNGTFVHEPCQGRGVLHCQDCGGRGTPTCANCNGQGAFYVDDKGERVSDGDGYGQFKECENCKGRGMPVCPDCQGQGAKVEKWMDPVRGYERARSRTCKTCQGRGAPACSTCGGEARKIDEECEGRGYLNCASCGGKGRDPERPHEECKGTGKIKHEACHGAGITTPSDKSIFERPAVWPNGALHSLRDPHDLPQVSFIFPTSENYDEKGNYIVKPNYAHLDDALAQGNMPPNPEQEYRLLKYFHDNLKEKGFKSGNVSWPLTPTHKVTRKYTLKQLDDLVEGRGNRITPKVLYSVTPRDLPQDQNQFAETPADVARLYEHVKDAVNGPYYDNGYHQIHRIHTDTIPQMFDFRPSTETWWSDSGVWGDKHQTKRELLDDSEISAQLQKESKKRAAYSGTYICADCLSFTGPFKDVSAHVGVSENHWHQPRPYVNCECGQRVAATKYLNSCSCTKVYAQDGSLIGA